MAMMKILKNSYFGSMQVSSVKQSDAQKWLINLRKEGRSYKYIVTIHRWIKAVFNMACRDDLIRKNPFNFSLTCILTPDEKERLPLTKEEQDSLLEFLQKDKHCDKYYNENTEKGDITEVIIRKHRNGALKTVELMFQGEFTRFRDVSYRNE